jgi:hypothetical protein
MENENTVGNPASEETLAAPAKKKAAAAKSKRAPSKKPVEQKHEGLAALKPGQMYLQTCSKCDYTRKRTYAGDVSGARGGEHQATHKGHVTSVRIVKDDRVAKPAAKKSKK